MCFPLFSLPVYQRKDPSSGEALPNEKSGWKKIESKECTMATLLISFFAGLALISIGLTGLFASSFHPPLEICIASLAGGVALLIPPLVALALGFKPSTQKTDTARTLEKTVNDAFEIKDDLKGEKANHANKVPEGHYGVFKLSNRNFYGFGNTTPPIEQEWSELISLEFIKLVFSQKNLIPIEIDDNIFKQSN